MSHNPEHFIPLIQKYNVQGPRYTSYPTVPHWSESIDATVFEDQLMSLNNAQKHALYVHIPFCEARCHYCACNVVITKKKTEADRYLGYVFREIHKLREKVPNLALSQIHWGGGTPTYLTEAQIENLFSEIKKYFSVMSDAEISIEIDPRVTTASQLELLRELGFNRVSLGVQDFNEQVQAAIHRNQTYAQTQEIFDLCRSLDFLSINMDFVYGLPYQTQESFQKNLELILELKPDRLAVYNYAHVPWMVPHQKWIPEPALPDTISKINMNLAALKLFEEKAYHPIGMDHFALSTDELVLAQKAGSLRRNFMGYTTQKEAPLLAIGVSAIGEFGNAYVQNLRKLAAYYEAIDHDRWPLQRGMVLTKNDLLRKEIIMTLLCQLVVSIDLIQKKHEIDFFDYFHEEIATLSSFEKDGLLSLTKEHLHVLPLGRLFLRNMCMVFDDYLEKNQKRHSRTL
ncbi:MAG: oxygen-independent coproporphyrinogen III oxidase [Deltaproteobacteria bacterium]|nr:oxygen-independent coproporphyrinogen III oxidase [Deltaproteobacteria bacterium]